MATHMKAHIKSKGTTRGLIYRNQSEGQFYAVIGTNRGMGWEVTICENNKIVRAGICGKLRSGPHKKKIEKGDFVLIVPLLSKTSGNEYEITHKYSSDEVKQLKRAGELSQIKEQTEETTIVFESDVVVAKKEEIEIDDDFINDI